MIWVIGLGDSSVSTVPTTSSPTSVTVRLFFSYKPQPSAEKRIYAKIADITISMKSNDHLKMPKLVTAEYPVRMSEDERERYDEMKRDLVLQLSDGEVTAANAAALSNKLCQMANGAVYGDGGNFHHIHDRKLDALEDLIEAANGKPVMVAYWFKHDLERISLRLKSRHIPFPRWIRRNQSPDGIAVSCLSPSFIPLRRVMG